MKIVCVSGGSYKSFYLNYLKKLGGCDLIVFNYGIIYNYNIKEELFGNAIVTKELMSLSKRLHSLVVAGVFVEGQNVKKSIIVCDGEKIHLVDAKVGIKLEVCKSEFAIGDERLQIKGCNKIILSSIRIHPCVEHCVDKRVYIFCDNFGVTMVKNRKLTRNFNKYFKIILK